MKAMLLAAGRGVRFRPVTERIPKALLPFLNVPLAEAHLAALRDAGVAEAGVNLHHLGDQVESHLRDRAADLPELRFFPEPRILGTGGALANAAPFLDGEDFFVVNADAAIQPDYRGLMARHRESGRAATLLVVENRYPDRYTPLQAEGDRITAFGGEIANPLLYTGVCVLAPRLLARIPGGERSLVSDVWQVILREEREEIGWVRHTGPFADLGRPGDFLRASLEFLRRGGPFPRGSGHFDPEPRVLALDPPGELEADASVLGRASIGGGGSIRESAVWTGVRIGDGVRLLRCLAVRGILSDGAVYEDALLWSADGGVVTAHPLG